MTPFDRIESLGMVPWGPCFGLHPGPVQTCIGLRGLAWLPLNWLTPVLSTSLNALDAPGSHDALFATLWFKNQVPRLPCWAVLAPGAPGLVCRAPQLLCCCWKFPSPQLPAHPQLRHSRLALLASYLPVSQSALCPQQINSLFNFFF